VSAWLRNIMALGCICTVSGAAVAAVFIVTEPIIRERQREAIRAMAEAALPGAEFQTEGQGEIDRLVGRGKDGEPVGVVYVVSVRGYGGTIRVVVGLNRDGVIQSVQIAEQHETPGLGSRIANAGFTKQFDGKKGMDLVTGAFRPDAITGATISSKAVETAVRDAINRLTNESFFTMGDDDL